MRAPVPRPQHIAIGLGLLGLGLLTANHYRLPTPSAHGGGDDRASGGDAGNAGLDLVVFMPTFCECWQPQQADGFQQSQQKDGFNSALPPLPCHVNSRTTRQPLRACDLPPHLGGSLNADRLLTVYDAACAVPVLCMPVRCRCARVRTCAVVVPVCYRCARAQTHRSPTCGSWCSSRRSRRPPGSASASWLSTPPPTPPSGPPSQPRVGGWVGAWEIGG